MYDVSLIFNAPEKKHDIDMCVVEMEENGYVVKRVKGYLNRSAIPPGDDITDANNSICKITAKGIEYYENIRKMKTTNWIAVIALVISCFNLVVTVLKYFQNPH